MGGSSSPALSFDGTDLAVAGNVSASSGEIGGWTIGGGKLGASEIAPNVFRAEWKDTSGVEVITIAYYDENKLLHVDLIKANGLSVMKFTQQDD